MGCDGYHKIQEANHHVGVYGRRSAGALQGRDRWRGLPVLPESGTVFLRILLRYVYPVALD